MKEVKWARVSVDVLSFFLCFFSSLHPLLFSSLVLFGSRYRESKSDSFKVSPLVTTSVFLVFFFFFSFRTFHPTTIQTSLELQNPFGVEFEQRIKNPNTQIFKPINRNLSNLNETQTETPIPIRCGVRVKNKTSLIGQELKYPNFIFNHPKKFKTQEEDIP
jgi:hypothetical protein